jgi:hypothetical protein
VANPDVLNDFAATDIPFLVLTDSQGMVRVLQPVSEDALILGGLIDSAIARVSERWPSQPAPGGPVKPVSPAAH